MDKEVEQRHIRRQALEAQLRQLNGEEDRRSGGFTQSLQDWPAETHPAPMALSKSASQSQTWNGQRPMAPSPSNGVLWTASIPRQQQSNVRQEYPTGSSHTWSRGPGPSSSSIPSAQAHGTSRQTPPHSHGHPVAPPLHISSQPRSASQQVPLPSREQVHDYLIHHMKYPDGVNTGWSINGIVFDVYRLFSAVIRRGGSTEVSGRDAWSMIGASIGLSTESGLPANGFSEIGRKLRKFFTTSLGGLEILWNSTKTAKRAHLPRSLVENLHSARPQGDAEGTQDTITQVSSSDVLYTPDAGLLGSVRSQHLHSTPLAPFAEPKQALMQRPLVSSFHRQAPAVSGPSSDGHRAPDSTSANGKHLKPSSFNSAQARSIMSSGQSAPPHPIPNHINHTVEYDPPLIHDFGHLVASDSLPLPPPGDGVSIPRVGTAAQYYARRTHELRAAVRKRSAGGKQRSLTVAEIIFWNKLLVILRRNQHLIIPSVEELNGSQQRVYSVELTTPSPLADATERKCTSARNDVAPEHPRGGLEGSSSRAVSTEHGGDIRPLGGIYPIDPTMSMKGSLNSALLGSADANHLSTAPNALSAGSLRLSKSRDIARALTKSLASSSLVGPGLSSVGIASRPRAVPSVRVATRTNDKRLSLTPEGSVRSTVPKHAVAFSGSPKRLIHLSSGTFSEAPIRLHDVPTHRRVLAPSKDLNEAERKVSPNMSETSMTIPPHDLPSTHRLGSGGEGGKIVTTTPPRHTGACKRSSFTDNREAVNTPGQRLVPFVEIITSSQKAIKSEKQTRLPLDRVRIILPIRRFRRERLIAKGYHEAFRDDATDDEYELESDVTRRQLMPLPRGSMARTARPREPEVIPPRFLSRPGPGIIQPFKSILERDNVLLRTVEHRCDWKGCDAVLASEEHLRRHVNFRNHPDQGRITAGMFGQQSLWRCYWRGCEEPCFTTKNRLEQHMAARHISRVLACSYPNCDLVSPTIWHLSRHVMKQHDEIASQPRPLADLSERLPPHFPIPLRPIPDTARTDQLTTRMVSGSSHRASHRQEWVREKVQKACFAGPEPIIHVEHPPHIMLPLEESPSAALVSAPGARGDAEIQVSLLRQVLKKGRLQVFVELPLHRSHTEHLASEHRLKERG